MVKQTLVHPYNEMLLGNNKEPCVPTLTIWMYFKSIIFGEKIIQSQKFTQWDIAFT